MIVVFIYKFGSLALYLSISSKSLCPEEEVAQLRECQKYDEKHDRKTSEVSASLKMQNSVQFNRRTMEKATVSLTDVRVCESCVMVALKERYLNTLIQATKRFRADRVERVRDL